MSDRSLGSTWGVHGDKLPCYFDGEMCFFHLSTSGQSAVSLRQTQDASSPCIAGGKTQLLAKGSQQDFLMEQTDPIAQPAGC